MIEPLVGIILVNYNNSSDTIKCIKSLEKIIYKNIIIIVIDNGSEDNSIEELEKTTFKHNFKLIKLKENNGFSSGNNAGILYARKEKVKYILLLNNDTLVDQFFLTELIQFQDKHDECDVSIGTIFYYNNINKIWYAGGSVSTRTSRTMHDQYNEICDSINLVLPREVTFASGCCLCIKASLIDIVGLLDEDYFLYDEDTDYCLRLRKLGKHIYYIPSSIIYHKVGASTDPFSPLTQFYTVRNHMLLIQKNFHGINKLSATIYTYFLFMKRCIDKKIKLSTLFQGMKAFYYGERGKHIT